MSSNTKTSTVEWRALVINADPDFFDKQHDYEFSNGRQFFASGLNRDETPTPAVIPGYVWEDSGDYIWEDGVSHVWEDD